jgi:streptomycin 6-kinase
MPAAFRLPDRLRAACATAEQRAWHDRLPEAIGELQDRWQLAIGEPFDTPEVSCAWVARVARRDGSGAVLKLGMPHMEAEHEIDALRFWNGNPTVLLLEADAGLNAMLLEICEPGTPLRQRPEPEQDAIVARLLRRLWRRPAQPHPFRPLSDMTAYWTDETRAAATRWPDAGLVQEGLRLLQCLARGSDDDVLLATDLHAGNILKAQREPWLAIDPKPFIGDRAYDATQHLFNCPERMDTVPLDTIRRFADLLEVDEQRIRLWTFARAAAEPRAIWDEQSLALARTLASDLR